MGVRIRCVGVAVVAALVLASCGGGDEEGVSTAPTRTLSTQPSPADTGGQPETSSPPAGGSSDSTTPKSTALRGADRAAKTSSVHQGSPVLLGVRTGNHPGYTRYVFDFTNNDRQGDSPGGSARPGWDIRYVPASEVVQDGSGNPVPVGGAVHLRIRFDGAAAHYDDGSSSIRYGLDAHAPLAFASDFEGRVTWFLGLEREQPFRVSFVAPDKVALDVATG